MIDTAQRSKSESSLATQVKATSKEAREGDRLRFSQPALEQHGHEIQSFDSIARMPIGLSEDVCRQSISDMNQTLADTLALRDLYKKCHWQVAGPTFFQLHLLFDKHFEAQVELADELAERIQQLGGISVAMAHDVAERTRLPRAPLGREEVPVQLARLLEAHELILTHAHQAARAAADNGDDGTNDLYASDVIRMNEKQVWFLAEHLVDMPLVHAE